MRRPVQQLTGLRAFEAAARHLSLARAAEELHVTPTAVGQHVRALEQWLGVPLFRRTSKGITLTADAEAVLPSLRDAFDQLAAVTHRLKSGADRGVVTVTVSPSFGAKWLMPRLEHFRALHPSIDLRLDVAERLIDFAREDVDVGVRFGGGRYPGLVSTRLLGEDVFPVCSPALISGGIPLRSPADLARHTLIHDATISFEDDFPTWGKWLRLVGAPDVHPTSELHLNSSLLATQAAIAGQGVALGRSIVVSDDLAAGRLIRPFGDQKCPIGSAYHLVHRHEATRMPKVSDFIAWIQAEAAKSAIVV
jgi:LysR family glycine cleavage system transcriptional activator